MALHSRNIFTVIELGTSKICALHGTCDKAGNPELLGFGGHPSEGSILKGAIADYNTALRILDKALEDADKSAACSFDRRNVYYLLSGPSISSRQGEGNTVIYDEDHKIKSSHIEEAISRAQSLSLSPNQIPFNAFDSYFTIDSSHRVKNPLGQVADRLDAYVHIISADRKPIETIRTMLRELGFENGGEAVFSGIASAYGTLSSDEREHGTLLVDFGAGVCDYLVVHNEGVLLSGVLPIGTDNLANDLSIGLDLNMDFCRRLLRDGRIEELRRTGHDFVEIPGVTADKQRRIPLVSFEKIIDMRLRETFSIIKEKVDTSNLAHLLGAGSVLCGGGALLPSATDNMREVMGTHVRRADVSGVSGAMTGIDRSPRYAALLGLLKYALEVESNPVRGGINRIGDALEGFAGTIEKSFGLFKKAFKI